MFDPYANFETEVLSNGLSVHTLHVPSFAGERFGFGIHSGARHDLPGKEGAAHYMEHLVHCNGGSSLEELKAFFKSNSGHMPHLGTTSFFWTKYGFHSSADTDLLTESLRLFGSMLLHAEIKDHMERERQVIIGEFNRKYPAQYKHDLARRMQCSVAPNTFLARMSSPLGTLETIKSMKEGDLQEFYDLHYTPANMSVVAVGELSLDQVIRFLERSPIASRKEGARSEMIASIESPPLPTERLEMFPLSEYVQGATVANYESATQLPGSISPEQMSIYNEMLSHRLFEVVRQERAWAYHVGCGYGSFGGDFRLFQVGCDGLKLEAINEIEAVVTECIRGLADQESLFRRSKQSGILKRRFQDPDVESIVNDALADIFNCGRIRTAAEEISEIESVSLEGIAAISGWLSPERRRACIQRP
ncbi:MAG: zinc protease [Parcubacteria group bacterium]|nr:zinc protease [Parcubacteria group bacterium]